MGAGTTLDANIQATAPADDVGEAQGESGASLPRTDDEA
jgi:hypothetical protein